MTRRVWRTIDVEIEVNGLELGSRMSVDGYQLLCDLVSHAVAADVAFVCHQRAQPSTKKVSKQRVTYQFTSPYSFAAHARQDVRSYE
jgi:hypothetical protein